MLSVLGLVMCAGAGFLGYRSGEWWGVLAALLGVLGTSLVWMGMK